MFNLDSSPNRNIGLAGLNFEVAQVLMMQRKYAEATALIESLEQVARQHNALPRSGLNHYAQGHQFEVLGIIARAQGQKEKALAAFESSRKEFDGWLAHRPDEPDALAYRAIAIAGIGRKDEALREAGYCVTAWPRTRHPLSSAMVATQVATVYAWVGDRDAAIRQLQDVVKLPGGPSPGDLKLNPQWDDLRGDARFADIIAQASEPVKIE